MMKQLCDLCKTDITDISSDYIKIEYDVDSNLEDPTAVNFYDICIKCRKLIENYIINLKKGNK